jgi:hypothetical protein
MLFWGSTESTNNTFFPLFFTIAYSALAVAFQRNAMWVEIFGVGLRVP